MSFNDNLHYLRKKNKITQEELADRLGVSRQSVSKWETGEAYPETEKLLLLCDMFGVTLDGLMRGDLTEVSESVVSCECRYEKHIKRFSTAMAVGVFLILFGVAVCVGLSGYAATLSGQEAKITSAMGGISVVLFVAAALFFFVYFGMSNEKFLKEHPQTDKVISEETSEKSGSRFNAVMAGLVSGILLDVVFLAVMCVLTDAQIIKTENTDSVYCYYTAVFLAVLSFIVAGLVCNGIKFTAYGGAGMSKTERKPGRRAKLKDAVCGAVMLAATALFLVLGFVWGLWHPGWVAFVAGGIICAVIGTIVEASDDGDKKD